jgi:hypothetical protein
VTPSANAARFPATTILSLDPYLWHWLAVTGALFLLSAAALALRLRTGCGRRKAQVEGYDEVMEPTEGHVLRRLATGGTG